MNMKNYRITICIAVFSFLIFILNATGLSAAGNQIMSHGHGNTSKKTDPKDLVVSPALKGKKLKPKTPAAVTKSKGMVPLVSISVHATFTANETNGAWRWNVMLQNTDPKERFPANRLKLKVVQLLQFPNQTAPAGSEYPLPALTPRQKRGFSSSWNRDSNARKLRMEIWDKRARTVIYDQELQLPTRQDALTELPVSPGARRLLEDKKNFEKNHILLDEGKYLGRGAWKLQLRSSGKGSVSANTYDYSWIYRFSTGNDRFYTLPKDITFAIPAGQPRTILEVGELYTSSDCDCAALEKVEVTLREKERGKTQTFDIKVAIPNIEIKKFWLKPVGTEPGKPLFDGKVYAWVINHSHYNLLLEWKLEVWMQKRVNGSLVSESTNQTGTLMLPARQTVKSIVLVQDLTASLPHLELGDRILKAQSDAPLSPEDVYLRTILTVSMPANSKCGPGRPLDLLQGSLVKMSVW